MAEYKALLPDWFCLVEADSEEAAQKLAAESYRKWLAEEPSRIIVWPENSAQQHGADPRPDYAKIGSRRVELPDDDLPDDSFSEPTK